jgi:hypothetical protein
MSCLGSAAQTEYIDQILALKPRRIIFNPGTGDSFSTNPIGMEIIALMKEEKDIEAIKSVITGKYNVDDATFEKDYFDFLNMLQSYQLTEHNA